MLVYLSKKVVLYIALTIDNSVNVLWFRSPFQMTRNCAPYPGTEQRDSLPVAARMAY